MILSSLSRQVLLIEVIFSVLSHISLIVHFVLSDSLLSLFSGLNTPSPIRVITSSLLMCLLMWVQLSAPPYCVYMHSLMFSARLLRHLCPIIQHSILLTPNLITFGLTLDSCLLLVCTFASSHPVERLGLNLTLPFCQRPLPAFRLMSIACLFCTSPWNIF